MWRGTRFSLSTTIPSFWKYHVFSILIKYGGNLRNTDCNHVHARKTEHLVILVAENYQPRDIFNAKTLYIKEIMIFISSKNALLYKQLRGGTFSALSKVSIHDIEFSINWWSDLMNIWYFLMLKIWNPYKNCWNPNASSDIGDLDRLILSILLRSLESFLDRFDAPFQFYS